MSRSLQLQQQQQQHRRRTEPVRGYAGNQQRPTAALANRYPYGGSPELYDVSYMPFRLLVPGSRQAGESGTAFREDREKRQMSAAEQQRSSRKPQLTRPFGVGDSIDGDRDQRRWGMRSRRAPAGRRRDLTKVQDGTQHDTALYQRGTSAARS